MPPHRPVADAAEIQRAAERILQAKNVVIVAGEGATASGAGKEVLALGDGLAAPIATSLGGRGLIPTRHRLSVGCAANYGRRRRTRSCTRRNWWCSLDARQGIRSRIPGGYRQSTRRACRSTSIPRISAGPIPIRWA